MPAAEQPADVRFLQDGEREGFAGETKHKATVFDDICFCGHCGDIFVPYARKIRYRRRLSELYKRGTLTFAVFALGLFNRPSHYSQADTALSAPDGTSDADMAHPAHAQI